MNLNTLNPSGVDAVIVDLDGTMVDTMGDFNEALNRMLRDLSLPPIAADQVESMVGKGSEHLLRSVLNHVLTPVDEAQRAIKIEALFAQAWASYQAHYRAINGQCAQVYPGADQGLQALRARGDDVLDQRRAPRGHEQEGREHAVEQQRTGLHRVRDRAVLAGRQRPARRDLQPPLAIADRQRLAPVLAGGQVLRPVGVDLQRQRRTAGLVGQAHDQGAARQRRDRRGQRVAEPEHAAGEAVRFGTGPARRHRLIEHDAGLLAGFLHQAQAGRDRDAAAAARLFQRRVSRTFFCSNAKNDSIAALSPAAPTRPIEPTSPARLRARTNRRERN